MKSDKTSFKWQNSISILFVDSWKHLFLVGCPLWLNERLYTTTDCVKHNRCEEQNRKGTKTAPSHAISKCLFEKNASVHIIEISRDRWTQIICTVYNISKIAKLSYSFLFQPLQSLTIKPSCLHFGREDHSPPWRETWASSCSSRRGGCSGGLRRRSKIYRPNSAATATCHLSHNRVDIRSGKMR